MPAAGRDEDPFMHSISATIRRFLPIALALALALSPPACEVPGAAPSEAGEETAATAARPEGWESLDDESAASRLYYQFVDEQRRVRFVERIEDVPEKWRANVGFVKMAVAPPLSPGDAARARAKQVASRPAPTRTVATAPSAARAPRAPSIVLYSAEWCGACKKAKRHLARRGVDYDERNVDYPEYAEELRRKTGRKSIPVLDVDGRVITGFNASSYDQLIGS
jgi:glutaredoxin